MNPFDYVKSITYTKERIDFEANESAYVPFIINRTLSYHLDCIFHANEINRNPNLDNFIQYEYYFHAIKKRKRFKPWDKRVVKPEQYAVAVYYDYNLDRAAEVLPLLKSEQLEVIKKYAENLKEINTS